MGFKGTPFSWHIEKDDSVNSKRDEAIRIKAGGDTDICLIAFHDLKEEEEANAKLIAAAPELLKALQDLLSCHETYGRLEVERYAKKAIEKALK